MEEKSKNEGMAGLGGRPEHVPTEQWRSMVILLSAYRHSQQEIADVIGIGVNTLRKYYLNDILTAKTKVTAIGLNSWMKNLKAGKELTVLDFVRSIRQLNPEDGAAVTGGPQFLTLDDIPKIAAQVGPGPVIDVETEAVEIPKDAP